MSFSQYEQDKFIDAQVFRGETCGVFVDIGANDGVTFSNSALFERERGWTGACVEPTPETFAKLRAARACVCIEGAVAPESGMQKFTVVSGEADLLSGLSAVVDQTTRVQALRGETKTIDVRCYTFDEIMRTAGLSKVDYLSIDTEGYELPILRTINFTKYSPRCVSVEENGQFWAIHRIMRSQRYRLAEKLGPDLIYVSAEQAKRMGPVGLLKLGGLPMRIAVRAAGRVRRALRI